MNRGKIALAVSTVFAMVGAVAFVVVVASPANIELDSGTECGPPSSASRFVYGMDVTNMSDHPLTIDSITATSTNGLSGIRYWALAPTAIGTYGFGVAPASDIPGWKTRRAVDGAPLPPHMTVGIVISPELAPGSTKAFATDFAITFTRHSGVSFTETSNAGYGYAPIDATGVAADCSN